MSEWYVVLFVCLFVWFWTFHGLSEMPACLWLFSHSFLQKWSISWSRMPGSDQGCKSLPYHPPYFLGLPLNGWSFAFLGNVLLVAGHDTFNIIQCSIHIFPPGLSFSGACLKVFEDSAVFCCGSFYIHIYTYTHTHTHTYTTNNKLLMKRNTSYIHISRLFFFSFP